MAKRLISQPANFKKFAIRFRTNHVLLRLHAYGFQTLKPRSDQPKTRGHPFASGEA